MLHSCWQRTVVLLPGPQPAAAACCHCRCSAAEIPEGALKEQLDTMVSRAFKTLTGDDVLNFSVAVTVMRVQVGPPAGRHPACVLRTYLANMCSTWSTCIPYATGPVARSLLHSGPFQLQVRGGGVRSCPATECGPSGSAAAGARSLAVQLQGQAVPLAQSH